MVETQDKSEDTATRDRLIEEIAARLGVRAERGRRFAELTSLRVGGEIDWVVVPETEEQAAAVAGALAEAGVAWRVLGAGSNVLADDEQHAYVVLTMREVKGEARFDGDRVSVSAGYSLPRLCVDAARRGLSGIEGLNGIPGTVGGALWMNAGAFGQEIGTVVESVRVARGGRVVEVPGSEITWDYRHTSFQDGELLLGATLLLPRDERILEHGRPADVLGAVAGVPLSAGDLYVTLTGCAPGIAGPQGNARGPDWRVLESDGTELYLRRDGASQPWRLAAVIRRPPNGTPWQAEYRDHQSGLPRTLRLTSLDAPGSSAFDLTLRLSQVETNVALEAPVFSVEVPRSASPITLDELRNARPGVRED